MWKTNINQKKVFFSQKSQLFIWFHFFFVQLFVSCYFFQEGILLDIKPHTILDAEDLADDPLVRSTSGVVDPVLATKTKNHVVDPDKHVPTISWSGVERCRTCFEVFFGRNVVVTQTKFHHLVGHEVSEVEAPEIFDASTTSPGEETTDAARKIQRVGIDTGKLSCFLSLQSPHVCIQASNHWIFDDLCISLSTWMFPSMSWLDIFTLSLGFIISWSRLLHAHLKTCRCASSAAQMILDRRDTWKTITLTHYSLLVSLCYHRCSSCWCFLPPT